MKEVSLRTPPAPAATPSPDGAQPAPARSPSERASLLTGASLIVASQAVLALTGLSSLPVLAHRLGPESYGRFSLFVTVLGVVAYQDFARQLIVHEQTKARAGGCELDALTRMSTTGIVALAAGIGAWLFDPLSALALVAATWLHGCASRDFASLSVAGRIGWATAVRNFAWAGAFGAVAALSLVSTHPLAYSAPFVVANLGVWIAYRRLAQSRAPRETLADSGSWLARVSGYARLRASSSFDHYRRESANLLGFTIAASVLACADRVLLERTTGPDELGLYAAQADLALRINVLGSALSSALFPMLTRTLHERGYEHAARMFVKVASATVLGYVALACVLLAFEREIIGALLGPAYLGGPSIFGWMLVGALIQALGFLLTPWLRAQGDFATPRRAYNTAVVAMLGVGIVLVPMYGAVGALITFLVARVAELQLFTREAWRLPRAILPRWKVVAVAGALLLFTTAAAWRLGSS